MVEENVNNKPKVKIPGHRPKSVYAWNVIDVQKWLRRHCGEFCAVYAEKFVQHEINGRTLLRITNTTLRRIGIDDDDGAREAIWREILKLRLKTDIMEIRDLQRRYTSNMFYGLSTA